MVYIYITYTHQKKQYTRQYGISFIIMIFSAEIYNFFFR